MTQGASTSRREAARPPGRGRSRAAVRDTALQNAVHKRDIGAPSYTVPEAAALCSISQEHLYRLVRIGVFPAIRMALDGQQGRYVVPATAVEQLLTNSESAAGGLDVGTWPQRWTSAGGDS